MQDWTESVWLATAEAWIDQQLETLGWARTAPVEQPHVRPWATVLRVPTDHGSAWFKANNGTQAYEAGAVEVLARRRPDAVPELLAVDADRGWLLMADGGSRLRELVEESRDLGPWLEALPRYGQLQLDLAIDRDELIARGVPDHRLATLPERYGRLLGTCTALEAQELARLQSLTLWVQNACTTLEALGVPETIQHDDLHDGQIFVRDGAYLFFDWGDACISHPFFTMSVTLEGVLSWGVDDVENSVDLAPYRAAYLHPFLALAPRDQLEAALDLALRLGWICRAFTYQATGDGLGPAYRTEYDEAVAVRLRMFLAGLLEEASGTGPV